jgi:hypothetical protein
MVYLSLSSHIWAIFAEIVIATYCFQNGYTTVNGYREQFGQGFSTDMSVRCITNGVDH